VVTTHRGLQAQPDRASRRLIELIVKHRWREPLHNATARRLRRPTSPASHRYHHPLPPPCDLTPASDGLA
jgi:hypothetical protein